MAAAATLSKTRYKDIANMLIDVFGDESKVDEALHKLCDIMKFDPDKKHDKKGSYNEKQARWIKEYRDRQKIKKLSLKLI